MGAAVKILGKTQPITPYGSDVYIATISADEINSVLDKSYSERVGELKPGAEVNLAAGHDFRNQIKDACDRMTSAMESFEKARSTLMQFALMVQKLPGSDEAQP